MKNNDKTKIAIFGGSFDPLHYGHVDIVKNLEKLFDRVIVVPSYISPFKTGASDGKMRYKLCKAVLSSDKTEVSRYEINKKSVSYSVDTAAYFAKRTDAELFWVIGSEELYRLGEWYEIDRLKALVTFYVVKRPHFEPDAELLKSLKKRKIKIKLSKISGLDISSTEIKIDRAFGLPNRYMPDVVCRYADKNGCFDPYGDYVTALYRHGLRYDRIQHIYRTAVRGAELAKKYGASVDKAVTACILHDIAKSDDDAEKYEKVVDLDGFPVPTQHSPIGAYLAKREFDVPDDVAHAIAYHTTACDDMSVLDEVVYLADKTENGRKYASLEYMRFLCDYDKNIAMLTALKEIKKLSASESCAYSDEAIAHYEEICGGAEFPEMPKKEISSERSEVVTGANAVKEQPKRKKRAAVKTGNAELDGIKSIAYAAADELDLHKAHDISIVDLGDKTIVADYFVIASASSTTAVKALMGYVEDKLTKEFGIDPTKRDVDKEWIALDYGGVIIHIFTDKTREFYNIERLWSDGHNIERYDS